MDNSKFPFGWILMMSVNIALIIVDCIMFIGTDKWNELLAIGFVAANAFMFLVGFFKCLDRFMAVYFTAHAKAIINNME